MATNHGQRRLIMMPPVQVTDDHLFGVDGPRWCPRGNPACEPLTPEGWPWFGDGVEVLISTHGGRPHSTVAGNASQWQMVCSSAKSRLGGIGVGGLCEGEPRQSAAAWRTYRRWIERGLLRCATRPRAERTGGARGFGVELAIDFSLLLLAATGRPYSPSLPDTELGVNIALGDVDEPARGDPVFGFHHESWLSGTRDNRTQMSQFGTLWMMHDG
jgi:SSS family solute:Na+ symporter|eukprot:Transcript_26405.p1 GENE.Transcript_26405~~Transcript_26405.p1  ORF type:complete len:215 (-),score=47.47 Transcript_26405:175-819(-)